MCDLFQEGEENKQTRNMVETLKHSRRVHRGVELWVSPCIQQLLISKGHLRRAHQTDVPPGICHVARTHPTMKKEAVKTNSGLHRVTSDRDLAAPTEYPQIHFFSAEKKKTKGGGIP